MTSGPHTYRLLSVRMHRASYDELIAAAMTAAADASPAFTAYSHFQILLDARDRPLLRTLLDRAALNVADGIAVRTALRLFASPSPATPLPEAVNATDFHHRLLDHCLAEGRRVYLLGGSTAAAAALPTVLAARHPGCVVRARHGGIGIDDEQVLADIAAFAPDLLFLGLGNPLQFEWIARNLEHTAVPLTVATGNFLEFLAGTRPRAPRWMRAAGLEWLHRLAIEPSRLWRRYLLGSPRFVVALMAERLTRRSPRD